MKKHYGLNGGKFLLLLALLTSFSFSSNDAIGQHAVQAAMTSPHNGRIYLFRGVDYVRLDASTLAVDPGYPLNIASGWSTSFPAGWEGNWDAMAPISDGTDWVYIFQGPNYMRWNTDTKAIQGPYNIAGSWSNIPASFGNIKAALPNGTGGIWLYDEDEYFLFDHATLSIGVSGTLASLQGDYFPDSFFSLDAAFIEPSSGNRNYIRGTQVADYVSLNNFTTNNIDATYASWPWTDAVMEFENGESDLDIQITDNQCSDLQQLPFYVSNPGFGSNTLGTTCRLTSAAIYLRHTYVGDLTIKLTSPGGVTVNLVSNQGGGGDDFGTSESSPTVFAYNSTTAISSGTSPFVGTFEPEGDFNDFLDGSSAVGTWTIEVCDGAGADYGALEFVELSFGAYSTVGIADEIAEDVSIKVYPNPANQYVNVEIPEAFTANTSVSILNMVGQVVYSETNTTGGIATLDVQSLAPGTYMVLVEDKELRAVERLVVR